MMRVLSLGAGVQSTTMALMAAHGEIEPPDFALFADTGAEPRPVYDHLKWLMSGNVLPFPVHIVSSGNLRADLLAGVNTTGHRFVGIPFHGVTPDGTAMMARRQCTEEYKLKPIRAFIRDRLGSRRPPAGACQMMVGISRDEIERMKPSRVQYITNVWPLIDLGVRRWDCLQWLRRNGYPEPPKSACGECPFRKNEEWRWLRDNDPASFTEVCGVDVALREGGRAGRFDSTLYLHRSLVPLAEADIRSDEDRGQRNWINECEGMCGV